MAEFYNRGGAKGLHIDLKNQKLPFDKLNVKATEKSNIVAFLKTLTDTSFLVMPKKQIFSR